MPDLVMPPERRFGWALKPLSSTRFEILTRPNGQLAVVFNHALLRGVTAEMLRWWFQHFTTLRVRLEAVPGYEGKTVPAYLLWHPTDHVDASLSGPLGPGGTPRAGATIHIREAMDVPRHGLRFPVDNRLGLFYVGDDGWAMGLQKPVIGRLMVLRIHFRDHVVEGRHLGVHYHYEVVVGTGLGGPLGRFINARLGAHFGEAFFEAWHTHNTIEVGTFENFLPVLHAQRDRPEGLHYAPDMAPTLPAEAQTAHDPALFERRVAGYRATDDAFAYQASEAASFL